MYIFLDLETTGLDPAKDEIIEIAIISQDGDILLNTLVKPLTNTAWPEAERINHISPAMVANSPNILDLFEVLAPIIKGNDLIIYNKYFDTKFLPWITDYANSVQCSMWAWSKYKNVYDYRFKRLKKFKLTDAAREIGYTPPGTAHRALADCYMSRAVWLYVKQGKSQYTKSRSITNTPTKPKHSFCKTVFKWFMAYTIIATILEYLYKFYSK